MAKQKKATKKFQKKHLKGEIQRRKKFQNFKKNKDRRENVASEEGAAEQPAKKKLEEMDLDEFLDGGFEAGDVSDDGSGSEDMEGISDDDDVGDISDDGELQGGSDDEDADVDAAEEESDSEASSDDEDDPAHPVAQDNKRLKSEVARHKAQLEALRQRDPEFYEYLRQTDEQLLGFGADGDEDGSESDEEPQEEPQEEEEEQQARAPAAAAITSAQVEAWISATSKAPASLAAVKQLLKAYRAACHHGDSDESMQDEPALASGAVFNRVLLFVLKEADGIFRRLLGIDSKPDISAAELLKSSRWRKMQDLVKSYLGNSIHLLGQMTEPAMLTFGLRRLRASVIFLAPFERLQKKLLKLSLQLFGAADNAPRVQAVLMLRQLAVSHPQALQEKVMRGMYKAFASNCRFTSAASAPHIRFMAACVVETYALEPQLAYQLAFGYIRQLAVLLRNALTVKTQESYREVYCWQSVHCLELWARLVSEPAPGVSEALRPLAYPVVQLLLAAARLVPTPRFLPLRLRLARALNRVGQATGLYIPVSSLLLEVLQWGDLGKSAKGSGQGPDMLLSLRVGKQALRSPAFQEEVVQQVVELLADHLRQHACSVAFPELCHIPLHGLRRFCRASPVERFRKAVKGLVDAVEKNAAWVGRHREIVDFCPKDVAQVQAFLGREEEEGVAPLQQYAAQLLAKAAARMAARSASEVEVKEAAGKGKKQQKQQQEEDEEEEGLSDDDGDDDIDAGLAGEGGSDQLLPKKQKLAAEGKKGKAAAAAAAAAAAVAAAVEDVEDGGDVVQDFVLSDEDDIDTDDVMNSDGDEDDDADGSDDDDDDDEEPQQRQQQQQRKGKPQQQHGKQQKGGGGGKRPQQQQKGGKGGSKKQRR